MWFGFAGWTTRRVYTWQLHYFPRDRDFFVDAIRCGSVGEGTSMSIGIHPYEMEVLDRRCAALLSDEDRAACLALSLAGGVEP